MQLWLRNTTKLWPTIEWPGTFRKSHIHLTKIEKNVFCTPECSTFVIVYSASRLSHETSWSCVCGWRMLIKCARGNNNNKTLQTLNETGRRTGAREGGQRLPWVSCRCWRHTTFLPGHHPHLSKAIEPRRFESIKLYGSLPCPLTPTPCPYLCASIVVTNPNLLSETQRDRERATTGASAAGSHP